jgi:hypothetical protein
MIKPSFRSLLMPAVGAAALPEPRFRPAIGAAVALSAITARAQPEDCAALLAYTNPQSQNDFAMSRHACLQAGLDTHGAFVAPWNQTALWWPDEGRHIGTPPLQRRGSLLFPPSRHTTSFCWALLMIGRMIAPAAQMMLLYPLLFRKLRFQMIDDRLLDAGVLSGRCSRALHCKRADNCRDCRCYPH